jgi:predicted transposase YdaD
MRESVVYQDILREGKEQGIEQGRQEGKAALVLRQLNRRLGSALAEIEARIQQLSLAQIEALGEALLDFETAGDLERWLGST